MLENSPLTSQPTTSPLCPRSRRHWVHIISHQQNQRNQFRTAHGPLHGLPPTTAAAAQWSKAKHKTASQLQHLLIVPCLCTQVVSPFPPALLHFHRGQRQDILRRTTYVRPGARQPWIRRLGSYLSLEIRPEVICDRSMAVGRDGE
jgi:hypothetical protein